jgi:hypothetical protein
LQNISRNFTGHARVEDSTDTKIEQDVDTADTEAKKDEETDETKIEIVKDTDDAQVETDYCSELCEVGVVMSS